VERDYLSESVGIPHTIEADDPIRDFWAPHAELRGAVEFAHKRISKLTGGADPALAVLEKALADGRLSARAFAQRLAGEDRGPLNGLEK
jgi:hypothetical protein